MVKDNDLISRSELLKHKDLMHCTDWTKDDFLAEAVLVEDIIKAPAICCDKIEEIQK